MSGGACVLSQHATTVVKVLWKPFDEKENFSNKVQCHKSPGLAQCLMCGGCRCNATKCNAKLGRGGLILFDKILVSTKDLQRPSKAFSDRSVLEKLIASRSILRIQHIGRSKL